MMSSQVNPPNSGEPDKPFNLRCHFANTGIARYWKLVLRDRGCAIQYRLDDGGARRSRTDDLMLAKHALYQLSYGPKNAIEAGPRELVVDLSVRPRFHTKCGGPRRTRTADLTLIRRVL